MKRTAKIDDIRKMAQRQLRKATGDPKASSHWLSHEKLIFDGRGLDWMGWPFYIPVQDPKALSCEHLAVIYEGMRDGTIRLEPVPKNARTLEQLRRKRFAYTPPRPPRKERKDKGEKRGMNGKLWSKRKLRPRFPRIIKSPTRVPQWAISGYVVEVVVPLRKRRYR